MPLGVLMLDTRFTRFVGDIGNPQSYSEPMLFEVVRGATVDKVVPAKAPPLIDDFVAAGERLIARGADAITTGCGFLVLNQAELASRLAVPVATSSLLLIPSLLKLLAEGQAARRSDILGARPDTRAFRGSRCAGRYAGRRRGARTACSSARSTSSRANDSIAAREAEVVAAGARSDRAPPDIGAILFECTNFPPHRAAVAAATGLPVYDIFTLIGVLRRPA